MPLFYPPVDFTEPSPIDKAGDHAEFKVLRALRHLDASWHVFHGISWRTVEKYGERNGEVDLVSQERSLFTTEMSSPSGKIRVGTIQAFKGLEADVVILCGIDGKLRACKPANLSVGASRARSMLYLLHDRACTV